MLTSHSLLPRYCVVILSNQGGLTLQPDPKSKGPKNAFKSRVSSFKQKCSAVFNRLDIPISLYAATGHDIYRKPRTGMWAEVMDDCDLSKEDIDLAKSIFIGDAGGRTATVIHGAAAGKDFSCSDRNFAHNVGIAYHTPEEFFLGEKPRSFARDFELTDYPYGEETMAFRKTNDKDVVLFCGPPGAGKSSFYWRHLKPLGYERVNQDILKRFVQESSFLTAAR